MSDNIFVKYSENNPNYYDGYWRSDPRQGVQDTSILYKDSYKNCFKTNLDYSDVHKSGCMEGFANMPASQNRLQIVRNDKLKPVEGNNRLNLTLNPNDTNLDSYSYVETDKVQSISCDGSKATIKLFEQDLPKMYDIDLPSIMKKNVLGDIKEIDDIHNTQIKNSTLYGDMKLQHLSNTMKNLHYNVNPRMLQAHQRSFTRERFFQDK